MVDHPDDIASLAELMTAANEGEAGIVRAALQAEGIPTWQHTADTALLGIFGASGMHATTVRVRSADLQRARELLDRVRQDSVDLDWNEVDVGQPEDALAARIAARDREFGDSAAPGYGRAMLPPSLVWLGIVLAALILTGWLGGLIVLVFAAVDIARRLRLAIKYSHRSAQ